MVTIGAIAFRSAWPRMTRNSDAPFARAVRTHGFLEHLEHPRAHDAHVERNEEEREREHGSSRCQGPFARPPHGFGDPPGANSLQ